MVETVAVSVLLLPHEERAELLATPLIDSKLARLAAALGEFAVEAVAGSHREGQRAGFARLMVALDDQPDPSPIPQERGGRGVAAEHREAHHRLVVRDGRAQFLDRERARVLIRDW